MRNILTTSQYERDMRRLSKKHRSLEPLHEAVAQLAAKGIVSPAYQPHRLHGEWDGHFECHLEKDWLLIYRVDVRFVYLYRTGSHDDLF